MGWFLQLIGHWTCCMQLLSLWQHANALCSITEKLLSYIFSRIHDCLIIYNLSFLSSWFVSCGSIKLPAVLKWALLIFLNHQRSSSAHHTSEVRQYESIKENFFGKRVKWLCACVMCWPHRVLWCVYLAFNDFFLKKDTWLVSCNDVVKFKTWQLCSFEWSDKMASVVGITFAAKFQNFDFEYNGKSSLDCILWKRL